MSWKILLFLLVNLPIFYISRASLRHPGSHGFFRFFAWEAILALFLLNVDAWFRNPFSSHQIISWILLLASFLPLILGVRELQRHGRTEAHRTGDSTLLAFEKTTRLVTTGIYRYIRHPLYSSLLLLTWGIFFKLPSLTGFILVLLATLFLVLTAKADERECRRFFGDSYQDYMTRTKMFVPFLF
jgi:protein-S-isoprenylcysteine O-methyltransferase Ste14